MISVHDPMHSIYHITTIFLSEYEKDLDTMIEKETGGDLEKLFIEILKVNLVNPVRISLETCIWGNSAVDI
jgi:hypothetical protein